MQTLLAVGGLLALLGLTVVILKRPTVVLYAITVLAVASWDFPNLPAVMSVGGASVYPEDLLMGAAVLALLHRPRKFFDNSRPILAWAIISAICLIGSLIAGLVVFGPSAVNEFRDFLYPVVAVAWGLGQDWSSPSWQAQFRKWLVVTGWGLCLIALVHIGLYGLGEADTFVTSVFSGEERTARPLTSSQALMLAVIAFYLLSQNKGRRNIPTFLTAGAFLVMVLLVQHRSVWVASAAGIVALAFLLRGKAASRTIVAGVFVALGATAFLMSGGADKILEQIAHSLNSSLTYESRTSSWQSLLDQSVEKGEETVIFGSPFGSGYERVEIDRIVEWAPHNWYLTVYLRLGAFGLAAFLLLLAIIMVRAFSARNAGAVAAFGAILVYLWAYSFPWFLAPLLAWCVVSGKKRAVGGEEFLPTWGARKFAHLTPACPRAAAMHALGGA
ncbi:O-antigen ligase family protein [Arthrobacter crystallopoietes]|uniref:O-antigen ligase family protein n=1 Tax=Crystallibacter crystallopoietes TaxID=37928 RepID=UPI0011111E98|nr:hypothetical protein [Arthrobacter crystallopoietes]